MKTTPSQQIYSAVENAYGYFNQVLFGSQLPDCLIVLQRQPRMMGYVSHKRWISSQKEVTDELAINPEYFLGFPLMEIMQTLVHEQCHIWQNHFGTPGRRGYHNKQWADKMQDVGLMPSHTGAPGGNKTGEHMNDYAILGGKFQEAFQALLNTGFQLPWLDRLPVRKPRNNIKIFNPEGTPAEKILPEEDVSFFSVPAGGQELSINNLDIAINAFGEGESTNIALPVEQQKRNTRVKYRCPCCSTQVWGKPALNLLCGDCNSQFLEL